MADTDQMTRMVPFKYDSPEVPKKRGKIRVNLTQTDNARFQIQRAFKDVGEANMHAHTAQDATWFVLAGEVEFYGYRDVLIARLGKYEGLTVPRGIPYWWKAVSDEPLEIIHASSGTSEVKSEQVNYWPVPAGVELRGRDATDEEKEWAAKVAQASVAR